MNRKRIAAERRGRRAEHLAIWWLRLKGYRLLAQDFRVPVGEIDLIMRRGATLAFVEVKRRADATAAAEAITPRQRQRIARAAQLYLQRRPDLGHLTYRFDAILLSPHRLPRHIINAWN